MKISPEVEKQVQLNCPKGHGPAELPMEGKWVQVKEISQISGLSHGVGRCAPQQGCCKLTLNVKDGVIVEALVETTGCTGATHGAAVAGEHLVGKTLLEALNTHLACDAINVAMREIFMQMVYGRSQTAFTDDGLPVGATLEDLGKGLISANGAVFSTLQKGPRLLQMAEGYVLDMAVNEEKEVTGYRFVHLGKMMDRIRKGESPDEAFKACTGTYGQYEDAADYIDPREK
jgi:NifU-like protein involved in Fe-S cluster formation